MLQKISFQTLGWTISFCGMGIAGAMVFIKRNFEASLKKETYFKEALKVLRGNKAAITYLGEPIKDGRIDLADTKRNHCDPRSAQFEVPVRGPKMKGILYLNACRSDDSNGKWEINKLELELKDSSGGKMNLLGSSINAESIM